MGTVNKVWFRNTSLLQINTESQLNACFMLRSQRERESESKSPLSPAGYSSRHSGRLSDYPRGLLAPRALPLLSTCPSVYKDIIIIIS